MSAYRVAVLSMVVSRVMIPHGPVLLHGTLRVCAKGGSSRFFPSLALLTLVAGLLARRQYPEIPVTGHLGTGFSWFPCV